MYTSHTVFSAREVNLPLCSAHGHEDGHVVAFSEKTKASEFKVVFLLCKFFQSYTDKYFYSNNFVSTHSCPDSLIPSFLWKVEGTL